jgi:hypothetical protein
LFVSGKFNCLPAEELSWLLCKSQSTEIYGQKEWWDI